MADFQKTLSQQGGIQTRVQKGAPPSVAGPLRTMATMFEQIGAGRAATAKATSEDGADQVYLDAQRVLAEEEVQTAQDFAELEVLSSKMPALFEDGQLTAEESEQLRPYTSRLERIQLIMNPAKRNAELKKLKAAFLSDPRLDMAKAEDVKRISDALNINITQQTAEERYGQSIVKMTQERYVNPTPFHYTMTARLNEADYQIDRASKAIELQFKQGKVDGAAVVGLYGSILQREFMDQVLALDNEFSNNGAIDTSSLLRFQTTMQQAVDAAKSQVHGFAASAQAEGKFVDTSDMLKQIDEQAAFLLDLSKRYGEDPSMPARQKKLIQSLTDRPELWQTREFLELAYKADMSFDTIRGYLANNNLGQLFEKLNVPMPDRGSLEQGVKMLFKAMTTLSGDGLQSPDDGLEKLRQHISLKWASTVPGKDTPADKVPAPVLYKAIETINGGTPQQVFTTLKNTPGLAANLENDQQAKAQTVAMIRNNLRLLVDELENRQISKVGNSYMVANSGSTVGGNWGLSNDTRLSDTVNAAISFLSTGQASKLLGGTYERDLLNAVVTKQPKPKAPTRAEAKAPKIDPAAVTAKVEPAAAGKWTPPDPETKAQYQQTYEPLIRTTAEEAGLDPDLFLSLIEQESSFDPSATSHAGAVGLAQLMPKTAESLGLDEDTFYDPKENLEAGAEYLALMLKKYKGDVGLALAAYNAGPGSVRKHGGIPPFKETQEYVKKIKLAYELRKKSE